MKKVRSRAEKAGLSPGTLVYVGDSSGAVPKIYAVAFDEKNLFESECTTVEDALALQGKAATLWINVDGIHDVETIRRIGEHFGLHPLTLEDILNPHQRAKREEFESFVYIVARALSWPDVAQPVISEQVSIVLGQHFVLTFQEKVGDIFEPVRQRIHNGSGRIRKLGTDYLAYALLDTIVDSYFVILESMGDRIEELEERVVSDSTPEVLHDVYDLKHSGLALRRSVWPLREVIAGLEREGSIFIKKSTALYLRDVYDHIIQVIDIIENYREVLSGMHDIYLTSISNRMNSVMKTLTVVATIFMPLTFIVGIYGMNFEVMPELKWPHGYYYVMGFNLLVAVAMVVYFKVRRWI